jgi:opacity protein-like surface antigen
MTATAPRPKEPLVHWQIDGGYSDTVGKTERYLEGGYNVGLGVSVATAPGSPVEFRFDANYNHNNATNTLIGLSQTANSYINSGDASIWSGTLDIEFKIPLGGGIQLYEFGGGGAYDTRIAFREPVFVPGGYFGGYYCNPFFGYCGGSFGEATVSAHSVTKFGWNAGVGLEFPIGGGSKLFVEGRYNRVHTTDTESPISYVPITVGLRF